jgi:DNA primase (bacterial type)
VSIAEVLAEKLSGKRTASGFVCCCPAHEDTDPSLSIMEADDGELIVHCFANCAALDVYAALRRMNVLSDTSTPVERPAPRPHSDSHPRSSRA